MPSPARNATRLKNLTQAMQPHVAAELDWTTDVRAAVRAADLVLTATSAVSAIVEPEDLRPGAVISEVSLPHYVSRRVGSERPDVLTYKSEQLDHDVTVLGPISVDLKVATTGTDSDFVVKLIDVYPGDYPDYNSPPAPPLPSGAPPRVEPANTIKMGG